MFFRLWSLRKICFWDSLTFIYYYFCASYLDQRLDQSYLKYNTQFMISMKHFCAKIIYTFCFFRFSLCCPSSPNEADTTVKPSPDEPDTTVSPKGWVKFVPNVSKQVFLVGINLLYIQRHITCVPFKDHNTLSTNYNSSEAKSVSSVCC